MELLGFKWNYISEGNVHVVLQLKESEDVIRLVKLPIDNSHKDNEINASLSAKFVNFIMCPLLREKPNSKQKVIELTTSEVTELSHLLHNLRPEHRRLKSKLCLYAIRTPNLTMLSLKCHINYCVEIKPKEGVIPSILKPLSRCYYCLKQLLKLELHQIQRKSNYCPIDLFSGEIRRMKLALNNLISNPQNNFKMFKDGEIIYSECSEYDDFSHVLESMNIFENKNIFMDFLIQILLSHDNQSTALTETEELTTLLKEQGKCLQTVKLYQCHSKSFLFNVLQIQMLSEFVDLDMRSIQGHGIEYVAKIFEQLYESNLDLENYEDLRAFLIAAPDEHKALLSAVAKDCSIMISFSPDYIEGHPFIRIGTRRIPYRVSITDLEPKPIESLSKRRNNMLKIFENYQKHLYQKNLHGECKIQPQTETRAKQLEAWQHLITEYFKANKLSTLDIREAQNLPLFNNAAINRKMSQEGLVTILEAMARTGRASPMDKNKMLWEVYWHSLDEWGNMVYTWASDNGLNNSVCTLFELREGENTVDEEFHGLDMNILTKALKSLEAKGKCELMEFEDSQGVKFF